MKEIKQKRCPVCLEMYTPKRYGLRLTRCCENAGCRLDYAQGVKDKEAGKDNAKKKREFLANDSSHQKKRAQKAFNEYIRLRDAALPCVSCDKTADWHGQFHAGHYKTTGARGDLRFNEDNCHKQCSVCNNHLSGNLAMYRIELERRIGSERLAVLERVGEPVKHTAKDYAEITKTYQSKIKQIILQKP
jgi:hypothetical protein